MQTLRKRTSPCKYKNEPSRFLGEGITYKAKLIGILEVSEARGDKMCQDALNDLKTAIRAAGEHKQRITISISIDGLRLRDEKTGDCLYHHPVHKISFIAQDMSDSRAFGYIFGSPDTGHRFFGIKTDKTASQVVISMRDLFQVVFELKKKEIEIAKHHSEQHHLKYGSTGFMDSIHFSKDESDIDKSKGKYQQLVKSRYLTSKSGEASTPEYKGPPSEAIADLLDLEHELNSIQQGINQMDKITPSDPFGPLAKGEPYIDPFEDSFSSSKIEKPSEDKVSSAIEKSLKTPAYHGEQNEQDKHSSFFGSTASSAKTAFFTQFSPGIPKSKADDSKWFDQETESLFSETVNVNNSEPTSSPIALSTSAPEPDQAEGKKSPVKTDLFTELDPLGTGRVKPYVDKKDFFQELKNPPKKVLKEMITDNVTTEVSLFYFPTNFKEEKSKCTKVEPAQTISSLDSDQSYKEGASISRFSRIDPFEDSDPFEKTDPFQEETFPSTVSFPALFGVKSTDGVFDDKQSWKFDRNSSREEKQGKSSPTNLSFFPSSTLRVSLPPEKTEVSIPLSLSTITSKLKSSPNSPEDFKNIKRKCYQSLKQSTLEGSEESPVHEEPFVCTKITNFGSKSDDKKSPFKENIQSPPPTKNEKGNPKIYSSVEILDATTPDPPPRVKTALFSIKPPPLPPKKQSQPTFKPPARPPSSEDGNFHYDYVEKKESSNESQYKEELKCIKLKKQLLSSGKNPSPVFELKKQNSDTNFPLLPPPPHRRTSSDNSKNNGARKTDLKIKTSLETPGSVLNLKLNQLDNTGLENLAITLGIPSENIYSMTLQELTKMLADKYLNSKETKVEDSKSDTFEADFDSNFDKPTTNFVPAFDKYAVFKELIESENKIEEKSVNNNDLIQKDEEKSGKVVSSNGTVFEEEDKYAALRQLSLNTQKSENFSEEEEKDEKTAIQGVTLPPSAMADSELAVDMSEIKSQWQLEPLEIKNESIEAKNEDIFQEPEAINSLRQKTPNENQFSGDSKLFPLEDQFSEEKKPNSPRENWATFEKPEFEERTKSAEVFNENENSPFSSDGKEEVREIPFHWHQNAFGKRTRKDVPWQDDDESWDDYSPKESYCSDESSHEECSPEVKRDNRYEKTWNMCGRNAKVERTWNEKSGQRNRRDKWQEETEDEFEETWRKQRERTSAYDSDRKGSAWRSNHEGCNKRYEWCNSRGEPWDENERRCYYYGSRRKRSESDNEFRKRCDSDTSDKECVWSFQKTYGDSHGRSGKQKLYHGSTHTFRDCSEYCHESRSKHRKNAPQKRPNSASESKRSYEKMSLQGDYSCRSFEKTYTGKREPDKEEYSRYQFCKDSRYRADGDFSHYYSSYDRKSSHHSKAGNRGLRSSNSAQGDTFQSPNRRGEAAEEKTHDFGYFEPFAEKNYKYAKSETHFTFDSESENFEKGRKSVLDQETQDKKFGSHWVAANGKSSGDGLYAPKNNNDNFAHFKEEFHSQRKVEENGRTEAPPLPDPAKPPPKAKNPLSVLSRQESSSALRKSDSINIFSRDKDPFEGDDFFSNVS